MKMCYWIHFNNRNINVRNAIERAFSNKLLQTGFNMIYSRRLDEF